MGMRSARINVTGPTVVDASGYTELYLGQHSITTMRDRHTWVMDAQVQETAQTVMIRINRVPAGKAPRLHSHSGRVVCVA